VLLELAVRGLGSGLEPRMEAAHRIQATVLESGSFLPIGVFAVSWRLESSEDVLSPSRNDFYDFSSLSSFISCHVSIFAYVAPHLLKIETIINVPLGLPLEVYRFPLNNTINIHNASRKI
jgi:hypothetical protein